MKILDYKNYSPFFLFLLTFALYIKSLPPSVVVGDAGELITASHFLGIPHPPGYPTWCSLTKPFHFLPLGNIAYKTHLACALFNSFSIFFLSLLLQSLFFNDFISYIAGTFLIFSKLYWNLSSAEVYSLNALFFSISLWLLILFLKDKNLRILYLFLFLNGLSWGSHNSAILFSPFLFSFALYHLLKIKKSIFKHLLLSLTCFVLGLSAFIYLPVRSANHPYLNWGSPSTIANFLAHITRAQYGSLSKNPENIQLFFAQLKSYLSFTLDQFGAFFHFILIVGIINIINKKERLNLFVLGLLVISIVSFMLLLAYPVSERGLFEAQVFFIPSLILQIILFSYGLKVIYIFTILKKSAINKFLRYSIFILLLIYQCANFLGHFYYNCRTSNFLAFDYGMSLLKFCRPNTIFFVEGDNAAFITAYLLGVVRLRPDIRPLDVNGYIFQEDYDFARKPPAVRREIEKEIILSTTYPVAYMFPRDLSFLNGHSIQPEGYLSLVIKEGKPYPPKNPEKLAQNRYYSESQNIYLNYIERNMMVNAFSQWAFYLNSIGYMEESARAMLISEEFSRNIKLIGLEGSIDLGKALVFMRMGDFEKAESYLNESLIKNQKLGLAHFYQGILMVHRRDLKSAMRSFEISLLYLPDFADAYINCGSIYLESGELEMAVRNFKKAIDIDYHSILAHYNLGIAYIKLNLLEEAEKEFKIVLNYDFNDAGAHTNLGNIAYLKGDYKKAIEEWNLSLNINPDNPQLFQNLKTLIEKLKLNKN